MNPPHEVLPPAANYYQQPQQDMTIDAAISFAEKFGLTALLVAAVGLVSWTLIRDLRKDNKELQQSLITLTKESLASVSDLSKLVEGLSPAIGALGNAQRDHLQAAIREIKDHLDRKIEILERLTK